MSTEIHKILQEKLHQQMSMTTDLMNEVHELRQKVRSATALMKQYRLMHANLMKRIEVMEYNIKDCTNTNHHKDVI